jgi:endonuclease YncB( thermonuclease family)
MRRDLSRNILMRAEALSQSWIRRQMARITSGLAFVLLVLLATGPAGAADIDHACQLTPYGTAKVTAVRDNRTLALADGREVRLAAIEVRGRAGAALQQLAEGRRLRLAAFGRQPDRYGRLVAFVFVGEQEASLQEILLAQGEAMVSARAGHKGCAERLLAIEREARTRRRGLWADPNLAPLPAEDSGRLRAEAGHFVLVEGKILSVRASGTTTYLNFGQHWTRGFSVIILRRDRPGFAAAGLDPEQLEGRRVRVRGWIEQRRGPVMKAAAPAQIELIE